MQVEGNMPTVKGCPKCISIHNGGLLGRGAAKCKGCGGELAEVHYEISGLVWVGVGLFLAAVLVGVYPVLSDTSGMAQSDFLIYWSVQMAMELSGLFLFTVGTHMIRKEILGKLAESKPGQ